MQGLYFYTDLYFFLRIAHGKLDIMKYTAVIILSMLTLISKAQSILQVTITGIPAVPVADVVYMTGDFNNWNPQDERFRLHKNTAGYFVAALKNVPTGEHAFKFTRGSWDKVETDEKGNDVSNRTINFYTDTTLEFSVAGWKDGFAEKPKTSTASAQVNIIDTAFAMPKLGRSRRIWIYLPKEYAHNANKNYPVLYMHDGQNLFDEATAFAGEWAVDEAMDTMKNPCIVVGIDNGGLKRMTEYNPNNTKQFGKGEGKAYLDFIVRELKPYIDKHYRTIPGKTSTYMAGSSMGGLITFYAGIYYPDVFGRLGIFSPSFWIAPQIKTQLQQGVKKNKHGTQRYYFYAGGAEAQKMTGDMQAVAALLKELANPKMKIDINPAGGHNESTWRAVFPAFYTWISEVGGRR